MYFTYCQLWIPVVAVAFWDDFIARREIKWAKTERYEVTGSGSGSEDRALQTWDWTQFPCFWEIGACPKVCPLRTPHRMIDALTNLPLLRILRYALEAAVFYAALHWLAMRVVYQGSSSLPDPAWRDALGAQDVWLRAEDGRRSTAGG